MKSHKYLYFLSSIVLTLSLVASSLILGCASAPTSGKAIELKGVSFLPTNQKQTVGNFEILISNINEICKGELTVKLLGGPEVVPSLDLPSAVQKGSVDIGFFPAGYARGLVRGTGVFLIAQVTPQEERQNGAWQLKSDLFRKANLVYLGVAQPVPIPFITFHISKRCTKEIKRPQDLAGLKFGKGTLAPAFVKALGVNYVNVPMPELYTALDSGVIDGDYDPTVGLLQWGCQEVLKSMVEPKLFNAELVEVINMDTWNKLPKNLQDKIMEAMKKTEKDVSAIMEKQIKDADQAMIKAGVQVIRFTPEDTKWMADLAFKTEWDDLVNKEPEVGPQFRKLLAK